MKVIVSKSIEDNFSEFVVTDSLKKVKDMKGVDVLIIHTFIETVFDAGVFLAELRNIGDIKRFIYITSEPEVMIKMAVTSLEEGYFFEDDFYLEDEEELLLLLENLTNDANGDALITISSIKVVSDFIASFTKGEERIKAPLYLEQVNNAINELSIVTHQQEVAISEMGNSALGVFEKASTIIKGMDNQRKFIEQQLHELENSQANSSSKSSFGNSVMFFPTYRYTGTKKVLLFREYTPCRYLTSFSLAYANYLRYVKNKRVKVIFVHQKGAGVSSIYSDFTSITQESVNIQSLYDASIIATNNPKKEVWKELFNRQDDIFIVVDRLYLKDDIVSGKVTKINAVSGLNDVKKFNLKTNDTLFTIRPYPNMFGVIPTIKQYPDEVDARYAAYNQTCIDIFKNLDNRLGI